MSDGASNCEKSEERPILLKNICQETLKLSSKRSKSLNEFDEAINEEMYERTINDVI